MRLTRLELQGFKSFADPTVLCFDHGVTAIVGPNGCGKSNVSDAVRWVLGEQRARILRGAKMEEVIFQGSSARRAVNIAEVSLVFENDDGGLPVAFREVVVTRRLSRSGESDYLLNGASCRLRDIHDLLRGTGLGADAGVVIEQRMIDALLSDRPDDRRELFEEAAGVGLYRDRRRSTERRLEETAQDLARLDDLDARGAEPGPLAGAAAQACRAPRGPDGAPLLRRAHPRVARHEVLAGRTAQPGAVAWRRCVVTHRRLPRRWWRQRGPGTPRTRDASPPRPRAMGSRTRPPRCARACRRCAPRSRSPRNATAMRWSVAGAPRTSGAMGTRPGSASSATVSRPSPSASASTTEQAGVEALVQQSLVAEGECRTTVVQTRTAVESAERATRELRDRLRELAIDRESAEREIRDLESRSRTLDLERSELADAADALARELESASRAVETARTHATEAAQALERARADARGARDEDLLARSDFGRSEDLHTALQGRVHALEGLERERVGLAPAAARLLRERDRFGDGAVIGPLSDFVNTSATSAIAVERFLGMTLHAVLIRDTAVADAIREWHAAANPGPLLLLPLDAVSGAVGAGPGDLLSLVEASPEAAGWARLLLEHVRGLSDGSYVDARGAIWLPGATAGPGPLRRRAELSALRVELAAAETARSEAAAAAEAARDRLHACESAVSTATDVATAAQDAEREAIETSSELERRKARYERELHDSRELAARHSHRVDELEAAIHDLDARHVDTQASLREQESRLGSERDGALAAERALDAAREARAASQVQLAQAQVRLQVAVDREQRLDTERMSATERLASLDQELASLLESDTHLERQMAAWHADLEVRVAALSAVEARLDASERTVIETDAALEGAEHALDRTRRAAQEHSESLHHGELRFTELSGRRAAIRERLEAEWRRPLDDMLATFQPVELEEDLLRAEAEQLRQQLESLGPVNPLAIEEHEEEVKRLDFLTSQRNDLNDARNSLQLAIREIDTTARELFLATFNQVRENFRSIFMTLFGGGECDLRLENPEAPLDCDIEIHASPRGKRTQRIHLLSSGERALVALSLLFGIFLTKPSPFCLLDEVDAPLDDANIGRFVRMLNEFKRKTQFIVITHNPRTTTEAADAVYGITMQEPGVSTVVGVRMRGAPVDDVVVDDEPAMEKAVPVVPVSEAMAAPL